MLSSPAHGKHDDVPASRRCASPTSSCVRSPPANTEAEQALLGAILINNAAYHRVAEFLLPEHFGNAVHGRIYRRDRQADRARPDRQPGHAEEPVRPGRRAGRDRRRAVPGAARRRGRDDHQRRALRPHDPRSLSAARADHGRPGRRHRGVPARSRRSGDRADRARRDRSCSSSPSSGQAEGGFRAFRVALTSAITMAAGRLQARRQDRRRRDRVHRSRQEARRAAPVRPDHPGRPAVDGKDGARDQHRVQRREGLSAGARRRTADRLTGRRGRRGRRLLLARNVGRAARDPHPRRGIGHLVATGSGAARSGARISTNSSMAIAAPRRGAAVHRRHAGAVGRGACAPGRGG